MKKLTWIYWIFGFAVFIYVFAEAMVYVVSKTSYPMPHWLEITALACQITLYVVFFGTGVLWVLCLKTHWGLKIVLLVFFAIFALLISGAFPFLDKLWAKF